MKNHKTEWMYLLLGLALVTFTTKPAYASWGDAPPSDEASLDLHQSSSTLAGNVLYVSAQGGIDAEGERQISFKEEAEHTMLQLAATLKTSGMSLADVVSITMYITEAADEADAEDAYWKAIGVVHPARTVLRVAALPFHCRIQVSCIAVSRSQSRTPIWPTGWPRGPRKDPPAVRVGEMVYLSAQDGRDPRSGHMASDFRAETKQALDNVSAVMSAAGLTLKNIIWVSPYLGQSGVYDVMGKIYSTYFEFGQTPARGTIEVAGLPHQEHIVFSCVAGADLNKRKVIRPRNMPPSATASPGILYGDTLYLSAKDGFIPGQGMVTTDLALQTRQSMRNLLDGLEEADMTFADTVSTTIYLRDMQDEKKQEEIYASFFSKRYPVRTILQQNSNLAAEATEQVALIAVKAR